MRRAARRDQTEAAIIAALEAIGVVCYPLSAPGLPDLLTCTRRLTTAQDIALVGHYGFWLPVEVKSPGGALTPAQEETRRATPFPLVESVAEALALFGVKA